LIVQIKTIFFYFTNGLAFGEYYSFKIKSLAISLKQKMQKMIISLQMCHLYHSQMCQVYHTQMCRKN